MKTLRSFHLPIDARGIVLPRFRWGTLAAAPRAVGGLAAVGVELRGLPADDIPSSISTVAAARVVLVAGE